MLQIVPHMRILVARGPLDFRRGIDGTIAACRQVLLEDPFSGAVFVFRARLARWCAFSCTTARASGS